MSKKTRRNVSYKDWISDDGLLKIQGWARDGLTNEQIAHNIGINVGTLYAWKRKYKQIDNVLKKGKEVIDRQVENALLKRALGYEYIETKEYIEKTDDGKTKKKIEKTTKHMAPDTTAQIFWLKNRKPEFYRNLDAKKVKILEERLNIEKEKNGIHEQNEIIDDGFIEALQNETKDIWKEEKEKLEKESDNNDS